MVFTSFEYLFIFLPIAYLSLALFCRAAPSCWGGAHVLVIILSLFFYASWNVNYLWLLLASIVFNYVFGSYIYQKNGLLKKYLLVFAIAVNIFTLIYFKYTNFIIDTTNFLFGSGIVINKIVLPLAISFFTFQQIAWLVDQYRGEAPKCSFAAYSSAVVFFPHLIAGPIVHYHDLLPQFQRDHAFKASADQVLNGIFLISFGFFKKIAIADTLAPCVSQFFDKSDVLNVYQAWLGVFSYTMQLYFDFSGYCDIAIGSALLLGISLPLNFDLPYKSRNIQEFWQRWHITLGNFFARYLYIPLGGSRKGKTRTLLNLFIVMFLSGIWHGAGVGFVIWGALHGIAMVIQRSCKFIGFKPLPRTLSVFITFIFTSLAWIPFRAESWEKTCKVFRGLFNFEETPSLSNIHWLLSSETGQTSQSLSTVLAMTQNESQIVMFVLVAAFLLVFLVPRCQTIYDKVMQDTKQWKSVALVILSALMLLFALAKMMIVPYSEFIYFNF